MTHDLISDMLTRLRNASLRRHSTVKVSYTKINLNILKVFENEGYIRKVNVQNNNKILVVLKYKGWWIQKPAFSSLKRLSTPGQRKFSGYRNFSKSFQALKYAHGGIALISTSSGIYSHFKAKNLKKGGELLCYIS